VDLLCILFCDCSKSKRWVFLLCHGWGTGTTSMVKSACLALFCYVTVESRNDGCFVSVMDRCFFVRMGYWYIRPRGRECLPRFNIYSLVILLIVAPSCRSTMICNFIFYLVFLNIYILHRNIIYYINLNLLNANKICK
jgi:hypothetical protein